MDTFFTSPAWLQQLIIVIILCSISFLIDKYFIKKRKNVRFLRLVSLGIMFLFLYFLLSPWYYTNVKEHLIDKKESKQEILTPDVLEKFCSMLKDSSESEELVITYTYKDKSKDFTINKADCKNF